MKSQKYPKWEIEETETYGKVGMKKAYLMTRPDWEAKGIRYAIFVTEYEGEGWVAESQVWTEKWGGEWIGQGKTSLVGTAANVAKELEKRAAYWMSKR